MDNSNIYRFNGIDPFDDWTIHNGELYGYYPRNSLINLISKKNGIANKQGELIVPKTVTSIKSSCFRNNKTIKRICIPKTVVKISETSFLDTEMVLYVYKNSYAEKFARRKGLKYKYYEEGNN